jgi:H+/gluconate symporter-like permease
LGVPIALMMGMGCAIGMGAALVGSAFAMWSNRRHTLEVPAEDAATVDSALHQELPPLSLSLIPVSLPVFLIALAAWLVPKLPPHDWRANILRVLGEKEMALTIGGGQAHVNPVYFALAIGCGSKPFSWMNDAGFWIITRLSGLREAQTLRTVSPMMAIQGVAGLALTMIAAWIWPMMGK